MRALAAILLLSANTLVARSVRADEIKLKDGSKINGTVVAIEGSSYKVQTSYGYAMIEKDKIAAIIPAGSAPSKDATNSTPASKQTAQTDPQPPSKNPESDSKPSAAPNAAAGAAAAKDASKAPASPSQAPSPNPTAPAANPQAPAAEPIPAKTAPEPIHESVDGNLYINQTFGFRLFKPPSWDLIPDARAALESAVAALGTFDETTLMVIAREPLNGALDKHAEVTQRRVQTAYTNFRITGTRSGTVAGSPSNERHYRGVIDGHDWSGVIVTFARGGDVYTILGATRAETDLVQIQENVIARTISSLQFDQTTSQRQ